MFRLTEFANYSNTSAQPEHRTVVTLNGASCWIRRGQVGGFTS